VIELNEAFAAQALAEREDHELSLVTLCIGGGQGIAMLLGRG
jgi:acetyl-CoA acetyltransferase